MSVHSSISQEEWPVNTTCDVCGEPANIQRWNAYGEGGVFDGRCQEHPYDSYSDQQHITDLKGEIQHLLPVIERLNQELDRYGINHAWGLDGLLRHIYNNRDATIDTWKAIAKDAQQDMTRLRTALERIATYSYPTMSAFPSMDAVGDYAKDTLAATNARKHTAVL